ncbi:MAG TPA: DUF1329 domain-containing protein [Methylibium sp.]|nr:DUF1329 domain-containing protein [Methylibium sp.]
MTFIRNVHRVALQAAACAAVQMFDQTAAIAAATADEARQLGSTLTEFGAEKAGNKDGSIPAYTGGLASVPGYDPKTMAQYLDPFKDDKPAFSVDGKNAAQYDALLMAGTKAMLKQYPTFRLDVHQTRRSSRYPGWVLQNTVKNATTAKLAGEVEGDALSGADTGNVPFAGIPFPIPKTGYEVLWNHHAHYSAAVSHNVGQGYLIDTAGKTIELPGVNTYFLHPWYDKNNKLRGQTFDALFGFSATLTSPPSQAGVVFLSYYTANAADRGQRTWFYTPGQRRVRLAPEFSYDVPIAGYGGVTVWDDIYGYLGRMDRFDFKLAGKKELLVPYNVFGVTNTMAVKDFIGPKHVNPEAVRWERRRVWVVEGTRKPDARHIYSRRTFYVEEDCWCIVASEAYDNSGALWRATNYYGFPTYDTGGFNTDSWSTNDIIKGNYFVLNVGHKEPGNLVRSYDTAEGLPIALTPQAVAATGVR